MLILVRNRDYFGSSLYLLLFVFVVFQKLVSPAIGIFIIAFFVELFVLKRLKFQFSILLLVWVLLFIIYGLSILSAEHQDVGLKLLEYKMSFFIFPIIFSFKSPNFDCWKIVQGFLLGVAVLMVALTLFSLVSGESYAVISASHFNIHPSYSSAYITVALFIFYYGIKTKEYKVHFGWLIVVFVLSIFTLFALISFAAVLFMLLSVFFVSIILIHKRYGLKGSAGASTLGIIGIFLIVSNSPRLAYDYRVSKETISQVYKEPQAFIENNRDESSGTKIRMLMWMLSTEVIKEHPTGVGLGDIDFYLDQKVEKYGIPYLENNHLNPHNQFLQIGIDLGLLGIFFLITMFVLFSVYSIKTKNYILLFIIINLLFNCLFESMLQRQSGIIFYTLFINMFSVYSANKIAVGHRKVG